MASGLFAWVMSARKKIREKASKAAYPQGPYPMSDGWLPAGTELNFWQVGKNVSQLSTSSAMVEACVSAYSQTVAMCPGDHWRRLSDGGRERVTGSALTRIIRRPNDYQTISDLMLNGTRELYQTGEWFALAIRNNRFEISELHMMRSCQSRAHVAETGEIFYQLSGNPIIDRRFGPEIMVPARDVLHIRLHTPRDPLRGETPLMAAALDVAASNASLHQHISFMQNQARPSIVLATDQIFTAEQSRQLREAWDAQTRGDGAGGTPILTAGLKPMTVGASAQDSQLAELMRMSDQNIALVFRVPLQVLGVGDTPFASTEALMSAWKASGLGFALNHIEEAFGQLFGLAGFPDEYVEFNTDALLRSSFKEMVEGLARSTISGIHSPDEARGKFDLPRVPDGAGAEPRVQEQVLPLSAAIGVSLADKYAKPGPAAPQPADEAVDDEERTTTDEIVARLYAEADRLH